MHIEIPHFSFVLKALWPLCLDGWYWPNSWKPIGKQIRKTGPVSKSGNGLVCNPETGRYAIRKPVGMQNRNPTGKQNRNWNWQANRNWNRQANPETGWQAKLERESELASKLKLDGKQNRKPAASKTKTGTGRQAKSEPEPTCKQNGTGYRTMLNTDGRKIGSCNKLK